MKRSAELEKEAILAAANMMALAARTAPKTRGIDNIETLIIDDEKTRSQLVDKMLEISKRDDRPSFERDANSIKNCIAILVVGVKSNPAGLNCGYCGYPTCDELKKTVGICSYNPMDLGIATSSAALAAQNACVDNRIMYSIGRACLELKIFGIGVNQALGIPLSATGKSPFFDRK